MTFVKYVQEMSSSLTAIREVGKDQLGKALKNSKQYAKAIFTELAVMKRDHLEPKDFKDAFAKPTVMAAMKCKEVDAAETLGLSIYEVLTKSPNYTTLNPAGDRLDRAKLQSIIEELASDVKKLVDSVESMSKFLSKLDKIATPCLVMMLAITYLMLFEVNVSTIIIPFSTFVLSATFVFGNQLKLLFESVVFIFVMHPYDISDRVYIDGENLVVEDIDLLTTTFTKLNGESFLLTNAALSAKRITNVRRSKNQVEEFKLEMDISTPLSKLKDFEAKLLTYLKTNEKDWIVPDDRMHGDPGAFFFLNNIVRSHMIEVVVWVQHKGNWQDSRTRYRRRTALLEELLDLHIKLGIKPPQPLPAVPGPPAPPPPAATDPPVTAGAVGGASAKPS